MLRAAARAAEDAGDFAGALRLVRGLPQGPAVARWRDQLAEAAAVGPDDVAGFGRWLVHPALRWARERPEGVVLVRDAQLLLEVMGLRAAERARRVARVAVQDPVVVDAGLFDRGLLARYLDAAAGAAVQQRAGPVKEWLATAPAVWQVRSRGDGVVRLRDLSGDDAAGEVAASEVDCAGWRTSPRADGPHPVAAGALLYGRLVPTAGDPALRFVLPPDVIDQRCASRLLRDLRRGTDPQERIRALAHCRRRTAERLSS